MTEKLKVRWRGVVYETPCCLDATRATAARAQWPDGILDLGTLLDPERETTFGMGERRSLARSILQGIGERLPKLPARLDHAWITALLAAPPVRLAPPAYTAVVQVVVP